VAITNEGRAGSGVWNLVQRWSINIPTHCAVRCRGAAHGVYSVQSGTLTGFRFPRQSV
jgi:hypothetical protein